MRKVLVVIGTPSAPFCGSSGRKSFPGWFLCEHEKVFYAADRDQNGNYKTYEIPGFHIALFHDDSDLAGPRVTNPGVIWITETAHSTEYKSTLGKNDESQAEDSVS
jgi:hypothetical protein